MWKNFLLYIVAGFGLNILSADIGDFEININASSHAIDFDKAALSRHKRKHRSKNTRPPQHYHVPDRFTAIKVKSRNSGMFSLFFDVLYALWEFDHGHLKALQVDFGKQGLYYDPTHGDNWWNYYCEPIALGDLQMSIREREYGRIPHKAPWDELTGVPRQEAYKLISKYIKPLPHITQKVNAFFQAHFLGNYVIGVHYRGTDKINESHRISYQATTERIQEKIDKWAQSHPHGFFKIFIATDEKAFVDYAHGIWGDCVCCIDAIRSNNNQPLHYGQSHSPYQLGEDALIDMLLLSKSDLLVRTSSNLSLWSTYFNPALPVIELTQRY